MKFFSEILILILLCSSIAFSQKINREQKLQKINELQDQIKNSVNDYIQPDAEDLAKAQKEEVEVFRIIPRRLFDEKVDVRESGAFYSFSSKSHSYNEVPQILLSQNELSVGFYGTNYGFIADLGNIPLGSVSKETSEISFLVNYKPPTKEIEVKSEQRKAFDYETENPIYRSDVSASIGHSYVLRAISFDQADVLVAFKVYRKDTDGSLIIFWKLLENYEKPILERK